MHPPFITDHNDHNKYNQSMSSLSDRSISVEIPVPAALGAHPVDLRLPRNKQPTALTKLSYYGRPRTVKSMFRSYAIGSSTPGEKIYQSCVDAPGSGEAEDLGLFQCVYEAWKNHYNLRTSPEDWWFPVACKVAKAIDEAAKDPCGKTVRDLFANHEGRKNVNIDIDVWEIDQVDYDYFFSGKSIVIESSAKILNSTNHSNLLTAILWN